MSKELILRIQPKVIDHLGIKMYHKPVDVMSEFVANAWDADSEKVEIIIADNSIKIIDQGIGMTFNQCQDYFLTVGRDRRKSTNSEVSLDKGRPTLGRKGIGKFAGFGIAKVVEITSVSKENGELTYFEMDVNRILEYDEAEKSEKPIRLIDYQPPNEDKKVDHGTIVELKEIDTSTINIEEFKSELSRRFLLSQVYADFTILVNDTGLPESFSEEMEYVFPRDLTVIERSRIENLVIDEKGWGIEPFSQNYQIKWRIGLYEDPIETEELRGISIFAKGKLAQKPFFFDLASAISGQLAIEYMTGQTIMDFIDEGNNDLISTERQRINLQTSLGKDIKDWGIERIKFISSIWKKNRSEKRLQELEDRIAGFSDRLDALPATERKTIKSVLLKIATFPRLGQGRFQEWCNDILASWEKGRLKDLITKISERENIDEQEFLEMLSEADIVTALNIAESVKTKILAIGGLKERVLRKELENSVRDYIYEHPWIIHPKWERYAKERSVKNLLEDLGAKYLSSEAFNGRVDLALAAGSNLLLLEFMRPGLEIDVDHLDRINYYAIELKERLSAETGGVITRLESAYVIADNKKKTLLMEKRMLQLEEENIYVMTWDGLITQAVKQWEEYLEMLKGRNPEDKRIQLL
jgi:hypothetical protein